MKLRFACLSALLALSSSAFAAPAQYLIVDQSSDRFIDKAAADALWKRVVTPKLMKLYPPKKYGFATEVEGGFNASKTCVVTARVMLLPNTVTDKRLIFKPVKKTTTFDAMPNATEAECNALAQAKLKEGVEALVFGLTKD
jgi:hypothetical protein